MSNRKNGKEEMKLSMFANTMLISIEIQANIKPTDMKTIFNVRKYCFCFVTNFTLIVKFYLDNKMISTKI